MRIVCLQLLGVLVLCGLAGGAGAGEEPPLKAGVAEDAPPYVVADAQGKLTGFSVELFRLIAERMQRPIEFVQVPQGKLVEGLSHGDYDLLTGPIQATPDQAGEVMLTEGYFWSEFQFGGRAGEPVKALADLKGRRLAVSGGTPYAEWAERNAAKYGFTVLPTHSGMAAVEAVLKRDADASLTGSQVQALAGRRDATYVAGLSLPETRTHASAAARRGDAELRDEMEDALRCLKINGTVARLSKQWLGYDPDAEDLENLVVPGYGVPGLAGYDPKPKKTRC